MTNKPEESNHEKLMLLNREERDLLVEVRVKLEALHQDVKELKDNTTRRVDALEIEKISKEETYRMKKAADEIRLDHENRIRRLERWCTLAIGGLVVLELALKFLL